ncbi:unnamed protein product [Rhizophagus irregularis]|uniref:Protein kinase domain-containing protein n=1 Tax=Rhizophagus irregularis TaxID=588596 RepID=A0A915ZDS9_9GLOM|nr:unnamed protein product [Rhizophagus irregularis]
MSTICFISWNVWNLHGGNLLIEDEKVSARISDVGLYEPCNYDKSRSQLYGSYHMLRRNFYVAKIKVLPLTWIQDNDPGKRPTASYLNENLEEWIILICDDPNPSKISGKNSIVREKRWRKISQLSKKFFIRKLSS